MGRLDWIKTPQDLVTTKDATRYGFFLQATEKSKRAEPYIKRAIELFDYITNQQDPKQVFKKDDYKEDLLSAAGLSTKSINHLSDDDKQKLIESVLGTIQEPDVKAYALQIVSRYLLTKGDSLGGSMRNIVGSQAGSKVIKYLTEELNSRRIKYEIVKNSNGKISKIYWQNRLILFDFNLDIVKKNIDFIMIDSSDGNFDINSRVFIEHPRLVIACGEIKGGIDPAGADEHWKTANSALGRIRDKFATLNHRPKLFFIGAAIESAMAVEIFNQIKNREIDCAANLTNDVQVKEITKWLVSL